MRVVIQFANMCKRQVGIIGNTKNQNLKVHVARVMISGVSVIANNVSI